MYRRKKAREYFVERVRQAYEQVFDEENDGYFYYNRLTGTSQWTPPRVLLGRPHDPKVSSLEGFFVTRSTRALPEYITTSSRAEDVGGAPT